MKRDFKETKTQSFIFYIINSTIEIWWSLYFVKIYKNEYF